MKVSLLVENLEKYLPLINKALPNHSQVPILSNIFLEAKTDGFYIKSTDLEIGVQIKIPAKIEETGATTVPGKQFIEIVSSLPKDKLTLSLEKDALKLVSRGNKVSFQTIPAEEFPELYKDAGVEVATFTQAEFEDIFSYLTFAVSTEETRPQLTGVLVTKRGGGLDFVATDGYRMSVKHVEPAENKKFGENLIVSVRLINEVMGLKGGSDTIVMRVSESGSQVFFETGDVLIVGRMIEGNFPDYVKAMPKSSKTTVMVDREEFLQNARLASVFARESTNILQVEFLEGVMRMFTKSSGVGEGEAEIEVVMKGEDNKIAFNAKFLLDLLKTLKEKEVTLKINGPLEPALFEVVDRNFSHIIMPIQTE